MDTRERGKETCCKKVFLEDATRFGVGGFIGRGPKVALLGAVQPWALVRNPVGIEGGGLHEGEIRISNFKSGSWGAEMSLGQGACFAV